MEPISRRRRCQALTLALIVTAGACDSLLDVDLPGRVTEDALDSPFLAPTLVASVVADVECSWDNYVAAAAHHSDEWILNAVGGTARAWGRRDLDPSFGPMTAFGCDGIYGLHTPLHSARVQAEANFARIESFDDAEVDGRRAEFLATIASYGAWPLVAFAEGFCEQPLEAGGPVLTPAELAQRAEAAFDNAIPLAVEAGLDDLVLLSRVGRARARLAQGDWAGAVADAELVPDGFVFYATREAVPDDRRNAHYAVVNGAASDGQGQKNATIAPDYRTLDWKGTSDTRVGATATGTFGGLGLEHWRHDEVDSFDSPTLMASWTEARLIMAEAFAMGGQLTEARAVLEDLHLRAGLPSVTALDLPTQEDVMLHVIEERRRELFSQGGHRLRDHLRWRGTTYEVPFLGELGSIHPNGEVLSPVDGSVLATYESATCFPLADSQVRVVP